MKYRCKTSCIVALDGVKTLVNTGDIVESETLPNRHFEEVEGQKKKRKTRKKKNTKAK